MKYNNYSSKKADLSQRSLKTTATDSEEVKTEEEKGKKTHATKEQMLSLLAGMLKKNQLSIPSSVQETEIHLTRSRWIMRSLRASIWGANALLRVVTSPTNITEEEKFDAILNKKGLQGSHKTRLPTTRSRHQEGQRVGDAAELRLHNDQQ